MNPHLSQIVQAVREQLFDTLPNTDEDYAHAIACGLRKAAELQRATFPDGVYAAQCAATYETLANELEGAKQ